MTNAADAIDLNDFDEADQKHIRQFCAYSEREKKVWRDDTAITLPSGKRVTCKSLIRLDVRESIEVKRK
jgi:hypothetical protein